LTMIASLGTPRDLGLLLERVTARDTAEKLRVNLLRALEHAARQRKVRPEGDLQRVASLLKAENEAERAVLLRLAGLWGMETVRPTLVEQAEAAKTSDLVRQSALDGLVSLGGPASKQTIETLCREEKASVSARRLAVISLAALDADAAAKLAVPVLSLSPDGEKAAEVFDAFLQRKNGAEQLAKALAELKLPADVARVGVRSVRSSGRDAGGLVEALTKAGSLTFGPRKLAPKELEQMVADVVRMGDAARGERVYRRKDMLCQKCHAIAGAGGQVGPDLTSIGASAQIDYLVESIVEPNKAVKENYHTLLITTTKGLQMSGIKIRQSPTELVLRDAEDKEITIAVKEIDEQAMGGSLMPDGLTDTLTKAEFVDLVRFLSELGKVGPYAVSKARLVRRWQTLEDTPNLRRLLETGPAAALRDDPKVIWNSAYSNVAGMLPPTEMPRVELGQDKIPMAFVRFQLDTTTAGAVLLKLNEKRGVRLWLNQNEIPVREAIPLSLPLGIQTVTLAIDLSQRKEPLRCELEDQPNSPARVRVVGGK
jgi:putative heme-binding domain-containing protein